MEIWELTAREQIRDTLARYNHAGDRGRYDEMVDCFAPDGVLVIVGGGQHRGRAAMRQFFSGVGGTVHSDLTQMRHCVTNLVIEFESSTAARASSYFQVITDIGLDHWGRYRDTLAPAGDRWLLVERSVKTDGYSRDSLFTPLGGEALGRGAG
jgi:ketosteroid isomerase-like protein